ncbi:MAG: hypothetical protein GY696_05360 [Gammaproteobacteria bacterium]|nr:hypothetical protein [Gammaproteobacteria bacterium]
MLFPHQGPAGAENQWPSGHWKYSTRKCGHIREFSGKISPSNLLQLMVYRNLGHHLNLGLNFCRQFKAKLNYEGDQPQIQIRGESYSLLNSAALERRTRAHMRSQ